MHNLTLFNCTENNRELKNELEKYKILSIFLFILMPLSFFLGYFCSFKINSDRAIERNTNMDYQQLEENATGSSNSALDMREELRGIREQYFIDIRNIDDSISTALDSYRDEAQAEERNIGLQL